MSLSVHLPCFCDSVTGCRDIFRNISQEREQQGTTLWSLTIVPVIPQSRQGQEVGDREVGLGYKWSVEAEAEAWLSLASQSVLLDPRRDASLTPNSSTLWAQDQKDQALLGRACEGSEPVHASGPQSLYLRKTA